VNAPGVKTTSFPLEVLLFRVGSGHFGVPATQVASTTVYRPGDGDDEPLWFHLKAGCRPGPATEVSVVADLRDGDGGFQRMVIGAMEDIVAVEVEDVRPMPAVVERYARRLGMWGVLPREGRIYILVDLNCLARQ
jgi:chemotaxis signal transduction protein